MWTVCITSECLDVPVEGDIKPNTPTAQRAPHTTEETVTRCAVGVINIYLVTQIEILNSR